MPKNVERVNAMLDELRPIAQRHSATLAQLVIAWTYSQPGITCVLCGARNAQQAIENAKAAAIVLSPEDIETIGKAGEKSIAGQ
jgi:methylglyoxal reductase